MDMDKERVYYGDYLQLEKITGAQELESDKQGKHAHDEMLFIVIHQAYELWFKQILYELDSSMEILEAPTIDDNSPEMQLTEHRLGRCVEIMKVLVNQIDILETMTALDFLDFRDMLRPASGFQSVQFKLIEAKLGLKQEQRYGKDYFMSHLRTEDRDYLLGKEKGSNLFDLVSSWLERVPYFQVKAYWFNFDQVEVDQHPFWANYREVYRNSLVRGEKEIMDVFDQLFMNDEPVADRRLNRDARRAALFIMLYRGYPLHHNPHRIITRLLEIDELLATWRYRHLNMVHRIIGARVGTGGSSGKGYLKNALDSHYVFSEFAELTSFLVDRSRIPELSEELESRLGFERV